MALSLLGEGQRHFFVWKVVGASDATLFGPEYGDLVARAGDARRAARAAARTPAARLEAGRRVAALALVGR
jgi:hypothetical protein